MALVCATLSGAPSATSGAATGADELAQTLQRKYNGVRDFSADFVHTYRGGALRTQLTERGHVLIKKPGKMRWAYTSPEEKLFVSDGIKMYSYLPEDKQVVVSAIPAQDQAATPALFLAGKGDLTRDFTATLIDPPSDAAGSRALKLVPRTPAPDYEWLVVVVDRQSLEIRSLVSLDAEGGTSTLSFANMKENLGLSDKQFTFIIPRGVEVVADGPAR